MNTTTTKANADNEVLQMTADTVGADLLKALVQEVKLLPDVWPKLSENKQNDIIDRLRARVADNIRMAVHMIASQGRTCVVADLEGVAIKDETKATFKISRGNQIDCLQHLYESVGKACLLVVADTAANLGGMDEIQGEADQRAMDLGREYDPNADGQDMASDVVDAEVKAIGFEGDSQQKAGE